MNHELKTTVAQKSILDHDFTTRHQGTNEKECKCRFQLLVLTHSLLLINGKINSQIHLIITLMHLISAKLTDAEPNLYYNAIKMVRKQLNEARNPKHNSTGTSKLTTKKAILHINYHRHRQCHDQRI